MLGSPVGNLKGALTQRTVEVKKEKVKTDFSVAGVRLWKSCSANSMLFSLYSDLTLSQMTNFRLVQTERVCR